MFGLILSGFLAIVFLLVLPVAAGAAVGSFLGTDKGVFNCYVTGFIFMMALCELIAVPCSFFKMNFTVVMVIYLAVTALMIGIQVGRKRVLLQLALKDTGSVFKTYGAFEYICLAVMLALLGVIIFNSIRLYVIDQDDSRFVVTAADIMRTGKLFLTDPNTGIVYDTWAYGVDAAKDIIAPHSVFCAILASLTATSATLFMHNIYPVFLYILAACIYFNLISELLEGIGKIKSDRHKDGYKYLFMSFIFLFTIFQFSTRSTRETVFLVRLWQGKAILAGVIIPALLWILYRIYRKAETSYFKLLFITSLAGCLTSSMATLLITMLLGIYGLVYGIGRKSIKVSLKIWAGAIIPVLLALLHLYIKKEMLML